MLRLLLPIQPHTTMKTRLTLILLFLGLFAAQSALARNPNPKKADEDCKAYVNQEVKKTNERIDSLKSTSNATGKKVDTLEKRLGELSQTVKKQSETINILIGQLEEVQTKLEINAKTIASIPIGQPPTPRWIKTLLAVIVAMILAVLGFFFWPRKSISPTTADTSARPKCPRVRLGARPRRPHLQEPGLQDAVLTPRQTPPAA